MTRSFIQLWTRAEFEVWKSAPNSPLIYAASNQFKQRGITKGDQLFIVACFADTLHLMGCLKVEIGTLNAVEAKICSLKVLIHGLKIMSFMIDH